MTVILKLRLWLLQLASLRRPSGIKSKDRLQLGSGTLIIFFAIVSQIITALFLLYARNVGDVPRVTLIIHMMHGRHRAGYVELITALLACASFCFHEKPIRKLMFLMPQQTVFLISFGSLVVSIFTQQLGGIYRPWQYVVLTQLYTMMIIIFHTTAILLPTFQRRIDTTQ